MQSAARRGHFRANSGQNSMKIASPKETTEREARVALTNCAI